MTHCSFLFPLFYLFTVLSFQILPPYADKVSPSSFSFYLLFVRVAHNVWVNHRKNSGLKFCVVSLGCIVYVDKDLSLVIFLCCFFFALCHELVTNHFSHKL